MLNAKYLIPEVTYHRIPFIKLSQNILGMENGQVIDRSWGWQGKKVVGERWI